MLKTSLGMIQKDPALVSVTIDQAIQSTSYNVKYNNLSPR